MFLKFGLDPDLGPPLLDERLKILTHGVGGSLVENREFHAPLAPHAACPALPARFIEQLVRAGDVLFETRIVGGGLINGGGGEDVARRPARRAVADLHEQLSVDGHRERLAHADVR